MINTGGFQINTLPQVGLADPELVALNPMNVSRGALSSLQLMDAAAKLNAFRQAAEEEDAIRGSRIQNTLNKYAEDAAVRDSRIKDTLGKYAFSAAERAANQPTLTDIANAKGALSRLQTLEATEQMPFVKKLAQYQADQKRLQTESMERTGEIEKASQEGRKALAVNSPWMQLDEADMRLKKAQMEHNDLIQNFDADKQDERDLMKAKIKVQQAEADFKAAQAAITKSGAKNEVQELTQEKAKLLSELFAINKTKVPDTRVQVDPSSEDVVPEMSLSAYEAVHPRDKNGNLLDTVDVKGVWGTSAKKVSAPNEEAEMMLARRSAIKSRIKEIDEMLRRHRPGAQSDESPVKAAPDAKQSQGLQLPPGASIRKT